MIPLIIDDEKLRALRSYAENHPVTFQEMQRIIEGEVPPVGDRDGYTCFLDYGFKLVYSIEEHPCKTGGTLWGRHMSVSLDEPTGTRVPSIIAVELLCKALGFKPLKECYVNFNQKFRPHYVEVFCETEQPKQNELKLARTR